MYATADYLQYFTRVQGAVEFKGAILTHISPRYFNVSCEQINLTPIP
jgi:hypothetical protein